MNNRFGRRVWLLGNSYLTHCTQALLARRMPLLERVVASDSDLSRARPDELVIDLDGSVDRLDWCQSHGLLYVGLGRSSASATELWPSGRTAPTAATALLDHLASPGLFGPLLRVALRDLCRVTIRDNPGHRQRQTLEKALAANDFAQLAWTLDVRVIHLVQQDTQQIQASDDCAAFLHTGADTALPWQAQGCAELAWGSHENRLPSQARLCGTGPGSALRLASPAHQLRLQSWTPSGPLSGFLLGQTAALTLAEQLTFWKQGQAVYHPTVCSVYGPSACTLKSLNRSTTQPLATSTVRLLSEEITSGSNDLGVLLLGPGFAWWTGSRLRIEQAWALAPGCNAPTVQAMASLVAAALWALDHPRAGLVLCQDLPYEEVLYYALPLLGDSVSCSSSWRASVRSHRLREDMDAGLQLHAFLI